jgi:hypothetical protein
MDDYESLSHTTWTCKYHVVFIPKCRRKTLYLELGLWRAQAQLRGAALLGQGILRQHGRPGRRGHPSLHPQPRERGSEARANEPLALTMPPLGGSKLNGSRQRPVLPL